MIECRIGWCTTGDEGRAPGPLCHRCEARIIRVLADLVDAHDWLGDRMVLRSTPTGEPVSGSHEAPAPLRVDLADQRAAVATLLAGTAHHAWLWLDGYARTAAVAAGRRHIPLAGPASRQPTPAARWLSARLDQLGWWGRGLVDAAAALSDALNRSYAIAPWGRARRDLPVPCPKCGILGLCLYGGDDWIRCRGCTSYCVPWWKYHGQRSSRRYSRAV